MSKLSKHTSLFLKLRDSNRKIINRLFIKPVVPREVLKAIRNSIIEISLDKLGKCNRSVLFNKNRKISKNINLLIRIMS